MAVEHHTRPKRHLYRVSVTWTGNTGAGTSGYRAYERSHEIATSDQGKPVIAGSSDPAFRGDGTRWNPEELLVAALAACHQLAYLHLCADSGIVVTHYADHADGVMEESSSGGGRFTSVVLRPHVTLAVGGDVAKAIALHTAAHATCFIASSVNFDVRHEPVVRSA
ncbi:MAG: OsmC family protein [Gemmatimonadaceae bacterium]